MFDKEEKEIYYISNLGVDKVSVMDGDSFRIIKEIKTGSRPENIIVDESNNIYIASSRSENVTVIHDLYDSNKVWNICNNGYIEVDSVNEKLYACNTEEVCIYNLRNGEKVGCINGFTAANSLAIDRNKERLFVLDILQNKIKVYSTLSFQLIREYKDIGVAPRHILIGEQENYIYIANKGDNKGYFNGNVSILDIEKGSVSYIDLGKGAIITSLEQNGDILYGVNSGLNRIEVIDIQRRRLVGVIKPTLPELKKIKLSPNKKILLATSESSSGRGAVDRIQTSNNVILDTFIFEDNNSIPYSIGVATQSKPDVEKGSFILTDSEGELKQKRGTSILAKKVISTYRDKIIFSEVSIKLPKEKGGTKSIERIIFQNCKIVRETETRKIINSREDYSILQYDYYIPYKVEYKEDGKENYAIEGRLEGRQKATLYVPAYAEQRGVEFVVDSFAKLISKAVIINDNLKFQVSAIISTTATIEGKVFIPLCQSCENYRRGKKEKRVDND